ncbi:methyltransferase domain-containing protein [bacterium]|nr:methyltransferase domain-containing protein [bacterium]
MDLHNRRIRDNIKKLYNKEASQDADLANAGGKIYGEDLELLPPELVKAAYGCAHPSLHVSNKSYRILDLGCGQGVDSYLLRLRKGKDAFITGIDLAYEMTLRASQYVNSNSFLCGSGEALPFKEDSFDCVISNAVIHLSTEKESLFSELNRVLLSSGELVSGDIVLERGDSMNPMVHDEFISSDGLFLYGGIIPEDDYFSNCFNGGFNKVEIIEKRGIGDLVKAVEIFAKKSRMSGRKKKKLKAWAANTTMNIIVYKALKEFGVSQNIVCPSCMTIMNLTIAEEIEQDFISERVLKKILDKKINYIACEKCGMEKEIGIPFVYRTSNYVYHVFPKVCASEEEMLTQKMNSMVNSIEGQVLLCPQKLVFGFNDLLKIIEGQS